MSAPSTRRRFLQLTFAGSSLVLCRSLSAQQPEIEWHDVQQWGLEGRGWTDQPRLRYFDRFPAKAEKTVPSAVWSLSRHSAGMDVHFTTDSRQIWVEYELYSDRLAMPHMPATGVSGVDLYAQDQDGMWRWVQVVKPTKKQIKQAIAEGIDPGLRSYRMYLPLYNGVERMQIGVVEGSTFTPVAPRTEKPLVFYGTSIMHGACASRPGMAIPAILGRRFDVPTINLGFSGNGRMDPPVVDLLAELDAAAYCVDCLPNMNPQMVRERTGPLVKKLRQQRPETPILLVEDRVFTNARFFESRRKFHAENHAALRQAYQQLIDDGVGGLYYLPGDELLGNDGEAATDGSHPSDLGFVRYADAYSKVLAKILGRQPRG